MIKSQSFQARFARLFVEPNLGEYSAHRLDPLHRGSSALISDYLSRKPGILKVGSVSLSSDSVARQAIMRQHAKYLVVTALAELGGVKGEDLALAFDVVQNADFASDKLNDPDA